jgi:hypothetical protein
MQGGIFLCDSRLVRLVGISTGICRCAIKLRLKPVPRQNNVATCYLRTTTIRNGWGGEWTVLKLTVALVPLRGGFVQVGGCMSDPHTLV